MNDRQIHLDQFEHRTHRVSEKPFAPGVITNARELDRPEFETLTPAESLFLWAAIVAFCVGLVGLVAMAVGWLSVVL